MREKQFFWVILLFNSFQIPRPAEGHQPQGNHRNLRQLQIHPQNRRKEILKRLKKKLRLLQEKTEILPRDSVWWSRIRLCRLRSMASKVRNEGSGWKTDVCTPVPPITRVKCRSRWPRFSRVSCVRMLSLSWRHPLMSRNCSSAQSLVIARTPDEESRVSVMKWRLNAHLR